MLTVTLATRDRADALRATLEALAELQEPDGGWMLLVVDNGSTDGTREVLSSFAARLPLQVLVEPRRGKSAALNRAVDAATSDLIVFTDDDVRPRRDWLRRLHAAAAEHRAYDVFGGAIAVGWPYPPPAWILRDLPLTWTYGVTPPELQEGPIPPSYVWGANMAIRRACLGGGLRFTVGLGPGRRYAPMGGETELLNRLSRRGHLCWHCPGAVVEHMIFPSQLTRRWLLRRAVRLGRGRYHMARVSTRDVPRILGVPRHLFRLSLARAARVVRAASRGRPAAATIALIELLDALGLVFEAFRCRNEPQPPAPGSIA